MPAKSQKIRTLLFLARINRIKGLDMLLPAWRAIQNKFPNWQLQIIGPDSNGYLQKIKQMAVELKLERVEFSGTLTGTDKLSAYQNAELFILPSYTENFGMSIAEALASGTPVITTKGTPWEILIEHNAGWWVDINVNALIECLEDALKLSHQDLQVMGYAGRQLMIDKYSWEHIGRMMHDTYNWVINGGTKPECIYLD
jgi:glycosyltransferase involved in cell wall biosynthesis